MAGIFLPLPVTESNYCLLTSHAVYLRSCNSIFLDESSLIYNYKKLGEKIEAMNKTQPQWIQVVSGETSQWGLVGPVTQGGLVGWYGETCVEPVAARRSPVLWGSHDNHLII